MAFVTATPLNLPPPSSAPKRNRLPIWHPKPLLRATVQTPLPTSPPLQRTFHTFTWRGHGINYLVQGPPEAPPVLLVHGFGASIQHWRKNIPALSTNLRVYAIDLLGFGASAKPSPDDVQYGIELWKELLKDFCAAMDGRPWRFVGNSIGSLTVLAAVKEMGRERVAGCALVNCAGGLVSFRYEELNVVQRALLWVFIAVLFNQWVGRAVFERFRTRDNVRQVLKQVYFDWEAVSDELVELICTPAEDEGACEVFLAVLNGEAGPTPESLLKEVNWCPMLLVWGEKDPWTPLKGGFHPGERFADYHTGIDLQVVPNGGHCIHDETPQIVNNLLSTFLTP